MIYATVGTDSTTDPPAGGRGGARYLRFIMLGLAIIGLAFLYNLRAYRNFATPEAMDSAQLARNLAEGKGYTTLFIRPFSLYLVQSHNEAKLATAPAPPTIWISHKSNTTPTRIWPTRRFIRWCWPD